MTATADSAGGWTTLPFAGRPARGNVTLRGGKSHAIRAIFLASQAEGISTILQLPLADDVERALKWIEAGGARVKREGDGVEIEGCGGPPRFDNTTFDAGDSAAVLRFGMIWCSAGTGDATITGSEQLNRRPHGEGFQLLRELGVDFRGESLPFLLHARGVRADKVLFTNESTSQFLSGLLLAAPLFQSVPIFSGRRSAKSEFYIHQTSRVLEQFGCEVLWVTSYGPTFMVKGRPRATRVSLEPDASHETIFACVPAILGGSLNITYPAGAARGENPGLSALERAGVAIRFDGIGDREHQIRYSASGRLLRGIELDAQADPDLVPPLAIAAMFAPEPSRFLRVERLQFKESDRLAALRTAIEALGGRAEVEKNATIAESLDLRIWPNPKPRAAQLSVRGDHRLAMAFALAGLAISGVEIDNVRSVAKSMADFFDQLRNAIGHDARVEN
ncbi:MAG: hypothetical protein HY286_20185 [Planctomycetes bacterium]|nr:hypothetical protein [Planctomycetota bacterium]